MWVRGDGGVREGRWELGTAGSCCELLHVSRWVDGLNCQRLSQVRYYCRFMGIWGRDTPTRRGAKIMNQEVPEPPKLAAISPPA